MNKVCIALLAASLLITGCAKEDADADVTEGSGSKVEDAVETVKTEVVSSDAADLVGTWA